MTFKRFVLTKVVSCLLILVFSVNSLAYGLDHTDISQLREVRDAEAGSARSILEATVTHPQVQEDSPVPASGSWTTKIRKRIPEKIAALATSAAAEGQFVSLEHGGRSIDVYYEKRGQGDKNIILLHGLGESTECWSEVIGPLSEKATVYALDMPGFGRSEKPDIKYSMDLYVDILSRFMQENEIANAILVGHSMGGQIAISFCDKYPDKTEKIVLVNTSGFPLRSILIGIYRFFLRILFVLLPYGFVNYKTTSMLKKAVGIEDLIPKVMEQIRMGSGQAFAQMAYELVMLDQTRQLRNIQRPVRLIFGRRDPIRRVLMGEMTRDMLEKEEKYVKLTILETGHYSPLEDPAGVVSAIASELVSEREYRDGPQGTGPAAQAPSTSAAAKFTYLPRQEMVRRVADFIIDVQEAKIREQGSGRTFIAFEGIDASGKSQFVMDELLPLLRSLGRKAILVKGDWAIVEKDARQRDAKYRQLENWFEYDQRLISWLQLLSVPGQRTITLDKLYNSSSGKREDTQTLSVDDETIVIVEGLFMQRPAVRRFMDRVIYIDIAEEESLRRQLTRDPVIMGRTEEEVRDLVNNVFLPAHRRYDNEVHPRENADMIIDNNNFDRPGIALVPHLRDGPDSTKPAAQAPSTSAAAAGNEETGDGGSEKPFVESAAARYVPILTARGFSSKNAKRIVEDLAKGALHASDKFDEKKADADVGEAVSRIEVNTPFSPRMWVHAIPISIAVFLFIYTRFVFWRPFGLLGPIDFYFVAVAVMTWVGMVYDIQKASILKSSKKVFLTGHEHPDFPNARFMIFNASWPLRAAFRQIGLLEEGRRKPKGAVVKYLTRYPGRPELADFERWVSHKANFIKMLFYLFGGFRLGWHYSQYIYGYYLASGIVHICGGNYQMAYAVLRRMAAGSSLEVADLETRRTFGEHGAVLHSGALRDETKSPTRTSAAQHTPFYEAYKDYRRQGYPKMKLADFHGWVLPLWFTSVVEEHNATREAAGLFDIAHMGVLEAAGEDARQFLQSVMTRDIERLKQDGQAIYSHLCYPEDTFIEGHDVSGIPYDDILVYWLGGDRYLLVVNASNTEADERMLNNLKGEYKVAIRNLCHADSESKVMLALQGPRSRQILQKLIKENALLGALKYYHIMPATLTIEGAGYPQILISRTGYTGELGFEVFVHPQDAQVVWYALMREGKDLGMAPAGLGARDSLRTEAGMPLYGEDLGIIRGGDGKILDIITSFEAGLGKAAVDLYKPSFAGKEALIRMQQAKRRIVGLILAEQRLAVHGYKVFYKGEEAGYVTSGCFSHTLGKQKGGKVSLAKAIVNGEKIDSSAVEVEVEVRGARVKAAIVKLPCIEMRASSETATSAASEGGSRNIYNSGYLSDKIVVKRNNIAGAKKGQVALRVVEVSELDPGQAMAIADGLISWLDSKGPEVEHYEDIKDFAAEVEECYGENWRNLGRARQHPTRLYVAISDPATNNERVLGVEGLIEIRERFYGTEAAFIEIKPENRRGDKSRFIGVGSQLLIYAVNRELNRGADGIEFNIAAEESLRKKRIRPYSYMDRDKLAEIICAYSEETLGRLEADAPSGDKGAAEILRSIRKPGDGPQSTGPSAQAPSTSAASGEEEGERPSAKEIHKRLFTYGDTVVIKSGEGGAVRFNISKAATEPSLRKQLAETIGRNNRGKSLLSIGIGSAALEEALNNEYGIEIFGVDTVKELLDRAQKRIPTMTACLTDGENLPFADKSFDIVLLSESIGHMRLEKALAEAIRVLKPGGSIHITTYLPSGDPDESEFYDLFQYKVYTVKEILDTVRRLGIKARLDPRVRSEIPPYLCYITGAKPAAVPPPTSSAAGEDDELQQKRRRIEKLMAAFRRDCSEKRLQEHDIGIAHISTIRALERAFAERTISQEEYERYVNQICLAHAVSGNPGVIAAVELSGKDRESWIRCIDESLGRIFSDLTPRIDYMPSDSEKNLFLEALAGMNDALLYSYLVLLGSSKDRLSQEAFAYFVLNIIRDAKTRASEEGHPLDLEAMKATLLRARDAVKTNIVSNYPDIDILTTTSAAGAQSGESLEIVAREFLEEIRRAAKGSEEIATKIKDLVERGAIDEHYFAQVNSRFNEVRERLVNYNAGIEQFSSTIVNEVRGFCMSYIAAIDEILYYLANCAAKKDIKEDEYAQQAPDIMFQCVKHIRDIADRFEIVINEGSLGRYLQELTEKAYDRFYLNGFVYGADTIRVEESSVSIQQFLHNHGYRATGTIIKGYYVDTGEDAYVMVRLAATSAATDESAAQPKGPATSPASEPATSPAENELGVGSWELGAKERILPSSPSSRLLTPNVRAFAPASTSPASEADAKGNADAEADRIAYELLPGIYMISDELFNALVPGHPDSKIEAYCSLYDQDLTIEADLNRAVGSIRELAGLSAAGRTALIRRLSKKSNIIIKLSELSSPTLADTLYHEWLHYLHLNDKAVAERLDRGFRVITADGSISLFLYAMFAGTLYSPTEQQWELWAMWEFGEFGDFGSRVTWDMDKQMIKGDAHKYPELRDAINFVEGELNRRVKKEVDAMLPTIKERFARFAAFTDSQAVPPEGPVVTSAAIDEPALRAALARDASVLPKLWNALPASMLAGQFRLSYNQKRLKGPSVRVLQICWDRLREPYEGLEDKGIIFKKEIIPNGNERNDYLIKIEWLNSNGETLGECSVIVPMNENEEFNSPQTLMGLTTAAFAGCNIPKDINLWTGDCDTLINIINEQYMLLTGSKEPLIYNNENPQEKINRIQKGLRIILPPVQPLDPDLLKKLPEIAEEVLKAV